MFVRLEEHVSFSTRSHPHPDPLPTLPRSTGGGRRGIYRRPATFCQLSHPAISFALPNPTTGGRMKLILLGTCLVLSMTLTSAFAADTPADSSAAEKEIRARAQE